MKFFILLMGVAVGLLFFFYAKTKPAVYTARATLFPLTAPENSGANSILTTLTGGGGDAGGNLSQEATISVEEVANSRKTRDEVVITRLPQFQNKPIAVLLIENFNRYKSPWAKALPMPTDANDLRNVGADLLQAGVSIKTNKNGLFELLYSSSGENLVSPISYRIVEVVTEFYTTLKVKKARSDFNFTDKKIDSLKDRLNMLDSRAVRLVNTTMFTPPGKIEYTIPKENLINDKTMIVGLYNGATSNREDALWRLQRATPILELLDKPDPPFMTTYTSKKLYTIGGFILGLFLGILLFITDILYKFGKAQVNHALYAEETEVVIVEKEVITTTEISAERSQLID